MTTDQQLASIDIQPAVLAVSPEEFKHQLEQAHLKAKTLKDIVEDKDNPLFSLITNKKHLHVEAWKLIARGYGYDIDVISSGKLDGGGFEATAEVRDITGTVIGHGYAECGSRGDGYWVERPDYAQRSMAQTRAIARAGRNTLDWVVVLAGYSPTPKEEMPPDAKDNITESAPAVRPQSAPQPTGQQGETKRFEYCPEHNTQWTQSVKQVELGYAPSHAIKDGSGTALTDSAGRPLWCNMDDWVGRLGERATAIGFNPDETKRYMDADIGDKFDMVMYAETLMDAAIIDDDEQQGMGI